MRQRITFLVMIFGICLNGCYLAPSFPYPGAGPWPERDDGIHWSKKGLSNEELRKFHRQCYPRWLDMYWHWRNARSDEINEDMLVKLEIEGQTCMLGYGFHFNDAPPPHMRLCSKRYAFIRGLDSYMIFPACQAKYGKYRK